MLTSETVQRLIQKALPDIDARTVHFFNEGWDFELWETDEGVLYRFPKREECAAPLVHEARLLSILSDTLATPVPRPVHIHEATADSDLSFFAYPKLVGTPLSLAGGDTKAALAREIGRFLTELHSVAIIALASTGIPVYTAQAWRKKYWDFRDEVWTVVSPLLTEAERMAVDVFWKGFLQDDRNFQFQPSLIHGDLGLAHILIDEDSASLTGVIDFADAMVGDPALDFVVAHIKFGDDLLASYNFPHDDLLLQRAKAYWQIGPFHEVLYGQLIARQDYVESGLAGIRSRIIEKA